MIKAISLFLTMTASYVQYDLPEDPKFGFAVDKDQTILIGVVDRSTRTLKVSRFKPSGGSSLVKVKEFEPIYKGAVEILPTGDGFVVVDYEGFGVTKYDYDGKQIWKMFARYPSVAKIDYDRNIWFFFSSGMVCSITPDSSQPEPVLKPSGEEIVIHSAGDLAPTSKRRFWISDELDDLYLYNEVGIGKKVGNFPGASRLFPMKDGSVLICFGKEFKKCSPKGVVNTVFTLSPEFQTGVDFMGRTFDHRLLIGLNQRGKYSAVIFDFRLGAP